MNSKSDAGGGMGYFAKIHYFFDHGVRCVPAEKARRRKVTATKGTKKERRACMILKYK